jgi:hypothetical protein
MVGVHIMVFLLGLLISLSTLFSAIKQTVLPGRKKVPEPTYREWTYPFDLRQTGPQFVQCCLALCARTSPGIKKFMKTASGMNKMLST